MKTLFPVGIFLLQAAVVLLLHGCAMFTDTIPVVLKLPQKQTLEKLFPGIMIDSWRIIYPEASDKGVISYNEISFRPGPTSPAGGTSEAAAVIHTARGLNLPVFACPVFCVSGFRFEGSCPAAALLPDDIKDGRLGLEFRHGFACSVLMSCSLNSNVYTALDAGRFRRVIAEKADELCNGDPWSLDPGPVLCRLGYAMFRESSVRAAERYSIRVPAEADYYISENPFCPAAAAENGTVLLDTPEDRLCTFIGIGSEAPDGSLETVEIISFYHDEDSWCCSNLTTGDTLSGWK